MALKKIAQNDNRNKVRIPLEGSPTITSSPHSVTNGLAQGCRYVNCFPVEVPMLGSDPERILIKAPGFETAPNTINVSQVGPLGAINWTTMGQIVQYFDQDGVFVATKSTTGSSVYVGEIFTGNNLVPELNLGSQNVLSPLIKVYNQIGSSGIPYYAAVQDTGGGVNLILINANAWTSTSTAVAITSGLMSVVPPVYLNNKIFWLDTSAGLIYNSNPINGASFSYTAGSVIAPQIVADRYFGMVKYRNHLCVLGEYSIEFFYDTGITPGSPLTRQEQYLIRHGLTNINNVLMYGDVMYFMGLSDTQGWGLYEVANFNLRKVSTPAIDAIINNIDDFAGQAAPNPTLNLVDIYGHACILMTMDTYAGANPVQLVFEIPKRPYGIMAPTDGQWWEYPAVNSVTTGQAKFGTPGPGSLYAFPLIFHTLPVSAGNTSFNGTPIVNFSASTPYNSNPASFYFTYPAGTTTQAVFFSKSRGGLATTVTGSFITPVVDFGSNEEKHVDYIDCVGDFGNNTVTISWTNDPTYNNWVVATTLTQNTAGGKYPLRWNNPGPFRQMALRYDFAGTSNIVYRGSDVSFNKGTI